MSKDKEGLFVIILCICSIVCLFGILYRESAFGWQEGTRPADISGTVVVIDAGHGGNDPGMVGSLGNEQVLEKDINLLISLKLRSLLEQNDITVVLTREEDIGLYNDADRNKKSADLQRRIEIINGSGAVLAVSIHQNSFTQKSSKGAQVFYYAGSSEGKQFGCLMQDTVKETIDDGNHRQAKSNDSYYLLKNAVPPMAIVECGFLSNPGELQLLIEDDYQEKLAWAIHIGIMRYLNGLKTI